MAPRSSPTPRERKPPAKKPVFAAGRQKFAKARPPAPKLIPVSEEMKAWSGLLEQELISWPKVVSRSMFGLLAFYRGAGIFAALPRTRALASARSLIFKLESRSTAVEARLATEARIAKELSSSESLAKAGCLSRCTPNSTCAMR